MNLAKTIVYGKRVNEWRHGLRDAELRPAETYIMITMDVYISD